MKLVLLSGMDGTGDLFAPLLAELSGFDCEVIALPTAGAQDYFSLTNYVREKLPREDFVLIAESFSGPVGVALAKEGSEYLKGAIFVATFLSAPGKLFIAFAKRLPLKHLSQLPFAGFFHKLLFLSAGANIELVDLFRLTINSLPSSLIKARLSTMQSLTYEPGAIELPVIYIQAASDRLVSPAKTVEFANSFSQITIKTVEGPHFILQAQPAECAVLITALVTLLEKNNVCDNYSMSDQV